MKNLYLFDFDGTLSHTDSSKFFFKTISNPLIFFICYYILPIIGIFQYVIFRNNNYIIKKRRLSYFIRFSSKKRINDFLSRSDSYIDSIIRKEARNLLEDLTKDENNEIVIVSASFSIILDRWAERMNLGLITNPVTISLEKKEIRFHNLFDCEGAGKLLLIKNKLSLNNYKKIFAFGDTLNDFPMFSIADHFFYKPFDNESCLKINS